jgi:hypothetical protein
MWPWIKRWRDWAMHDLWPMSRLRFQPQALHYGYEKAGLIVHDQPIPWSAEAVVVEALLKLTSPGARRKGDYQLRLPNYELLGADSFRRQEEDYRYRLSFRFPPPTTTVTAELLFRGQVLGQLTLPHLSRTEFLQELRLQMPTLFVRLGEESVACQTFVSAQGRGLLATGVLSSPTSLVPVLDLDLQVEFRCERDNTTRYVPARLCSSQLSGRTALVTVVAPRLPRRIGDWIATWLAGNQVLVSQRVRAISQRQFQRSLRISDTRFVVQGDKGSVRVTRQMVAGEQTARVGPCFMVCSREAGMAGLCKVQVRIQGPLLVSSVLHEEQEVLITDGPTMIAPGTLDAADLANVTSFELWLKGRSLGALSLCPTPAASFTSEGGFKTPTEFTWSAAADDELNERLNRLLEGRTTE